MNIQQLKETTVLPELQHLCHGDAPPPQPTGNISATQRCLSFVGVINVQNPSKPQKHQVLNPIKPNKDAELVFPWRPRARGLWWWDTSLDT